MVNADVVAEETPGLTPPLIAALALASLVSLVALWASAWLPAADLPQHEAQVALWLRGDPATYALQPFTPYLLSTALARLFAVVLDPVAAVRLVLTLGVLGLPAATWVLVRRTGGDPWWTLAAFPVAFGFAFRWGFVSYACGLPLALLLVALAWGVRERADAKRLVGLGLLGLALFFTHALAWGAGVLAAGLVLLAPRPEAPLRTRALRTAPLLPGALIALGWVVHTAGRRSEAFLSGANPAAETVWNLTPLRLWTLLSEDLLGGGLDAACGALALLLALAVGARSFAREPARWLPGAALLGLALLAPWRLLGTSHVHGRFAVLALLLGLVALRPREASPRRARARAVLAVVAVLWPAAVAWDARALSQAHGEPLAAVAADALQPGDRVYAWVLAPHLEPRVGDVLLHLPARLAARHAVTVEPSFARSFATVVAYRPGAVRPLDEANPLAEVRAGGYDLVLLHGEGSDADADALLRGWRRVARAGPWRAYRR